VTYCQTVDPTKSYYFGAKLQGTGYCLVWTYSDTGCLTPWKGTGGSDFPETPARIGDSADSSSWLSYMTTFTLESVVNSVEIFCGGVAVDQIYLSATAPGF
jgi:hypothetical protein